jgi:DNA mismatch endonuclease (patch repair protein)
MWLFPPARWARQLVSALSSLSAVVDVFTKRKRSAVMSRIRGRENRDTELVLVKLLRDGGISGWRRHQRIKLFDAGREAVGRGLYVRPDFTFWAGRIAIFVDGCFWHCCPRHSTLPRTNARFWREKLAGNATRDRLVNRQLRRMGWTVLRIWEHQLKESPAVCVRRIRRAVATALGRI